MTMDVSERVDDVAHGLARVPDKASIALAIGSIASFAVLYLSGHRGGGFLVGLLGAALASAPVLAKKLVPTEPAGVTS
jgi:hypothetical protein